MALVSDCNYFSSLANAHGVAALVWYNLEKYRLPDGIPEDVVTFLRGAFMLNLSRNTHNSEAMGEVLRLLNEVNIKTVLLKGLALEYTVYGNAGLIYENSYEIEINGEKAYIPQPQIFFLYLVKHLYLHEMNNESQLRLYTDLVVLIEKHRDEIINYDLLTYASQAGMSEILTSRLEPLRDLWGVTFPEWVDAFIDKWYNHDSINKFIFFLKSPKDNLPHDKARFYRLVIRDIPGLHRKFLFLLGDIFPSVSFMKNRYKCKSNWKVLLYYPHRIGKIFWLLRK
ncbi:MAG: nucleotidyltransferase family protein [Bacteroidia bacterium]|nr:nucleotidyltransferase family protein [Bacteroidia bacterium]